MVTMTTPTLARLIFGFLDSSLSGDTSRAKCSVRGVGWGEVAGERDVGTGTSQLEEGSTGGRGTVTMATFLLPW